MGRVPRGDDLPPVVDEDIRVFTGVLNRRGDRASAEGSLLAFLHRSAVI